MQLAECSTRCEGGLVSFVNSLFMCISLRPPTWEEVKAEIPRGPDVDPDLIEAPSYRDMSQEEALDLVRRGWSTLRDVDKAI